MREFAKYKCLESFESEGRYCIKDEIYIAYSLGHGVKFVFENGEMNFTSELFERTMDAWSDVLMKVEEDKNEKT